MLHFCIYKYTSELFFQLSRKLLKMDIGHLGSPNVTFQGLSNDTNFDLKGFGRPTCNPNHNPNLTLTEA